MPDLQTELSKVITQWEAPTVETTTPSHHFQPTNNVSRATFNYVRDNPGLGRVQVVSDLILQGYKKASTTSLIAQMIKQGLLRETNGALFATQAEYAPIKPRLVKAAQAVKPKRKYVRRNAAAKAAAYEAHENYNPTALDDRVVPHKEFSAEDWVDSLTLKQAKAVYEELKKVFG